MFSLSSRCCFVLLFYYVLFFCYVFVCLHFGMPFSQIANEAKERTESDFPERSGPGQKAEMNDKSIVSNAYFHCGK